MCLFLFLFCLPADGEGSGATAGSATPGTATAHAPDRRTAEAATRTATVAPPLALFRSALSFVFFAQHAIERFQRIVDYPAEKKQNNSDYDKKSYLDRIQARSQIENLLCIKNFYCAILTL